MKDPLDNYYDQDDWLEKYAEERLYKWSFVE